MANHCKIVRGRFFDGVTEATTTSVAKKIADAMGLGTVVSISITKSGQELIACICYTV